MPGGKIRNQAGTVEDHTHLLGDMQIKLAVALEIKYAGEAIFFPAGMVLPASIFMDGKVIRCAYIHSPYGVHELQPLDFNVHHGSANGTA